MKLFNEKGKLKLAHWAVNTLLKLAHLFIVTKKKMCCDFEEDSSTTLICTH